MKREAWEVMQEPAKHMDRETLRELLAEVIGASDAV
jgi:hypothetical protein